jgi:hypothetical protein
MELDHVKNTVWVKLPFIAHLKPNRFVAEQVFKTQLELTLKNPSLREDTVKSHQKLVDRGHVAEESELSKSYLEVIKASLGEGYFISPMENRQQWLLSTLCRIVFNASSKTPGGNSLKGVLAKGQRICKLQHLLVRFRRGGGDRHR